ncbi:MAG: Transrane amino acid transporter protein [Candidatus Parcubacteria bacterium]|jgi:amino acid permease
MNKATAITTSILFVVGSTLGAGIFALPFVVVRSGWIASLLWVLVTIAVIGYCQVAYARTLQTDGSGRRLLGLLEKEYGNTVARIGFIAIIIGLMLTLVIYLVLIPQFVELLMSGVPAKIISIVFWAFVSMPLLFRLRRLVGVEIAATVMMVATIIILALQTGPISAALETIHQQTKSDFFMAFAPFMFALAGWTAVEPVVDLAKRLRHKQEIVRNIILIGVVISALLYGLFVLVVLSSGVPVTADTISGLGGWGMIQKIIIAIVGIAAIATSYLPVGLEIENALQRDLRRSRAASVLLVIFFPLFLVLSGLTNFLKIVELVGAVFVGIQYVCIILVARKVLVMGQWEKGMSTAVLILLLVGALYQSYLSAIP